jgi:hypothetical protein
MASPDGLVAVLGENHWRAVISRTPERVVVLRLDIPLTPAEARAWAAAFRRAGGDCGVVAEELERAALEAEPHGGGRA